MVVVPVREEHALHVGDRETEAGEALRKRFPGDFRQRPTVDEGNRIAPDHMNVDRPDGEGRRNRKSFYER